MRTLLRQRNSSPINAAAEGETHDHRVQTVHHRQRRQLHRPAAPHRPTSLPGGNPRRHHRRLDPGPAGRNHPHPARRHRSRALPALQEGPPSKTPHEAVYLTSFEHATPEHCGTPSSRRSTKTASPSPGGPSARPHPPSPSSTAPHSAVSTTPSSGSPIITNAAVRWISQVTAGLPILEIGAGNGYLASRAHQGRPEPHSHRSPSAIGAEDGTPHPHGTRTLRRHTPPRRPPRPSPSTPNATYSGPCPDLNAEYTHLTLRDVQGQIPQSTSARTYYGNTGSPEFHHALETDFVPVESFQIPTFPGLHDRIVLHERARHPLAK